MHPALRFGIEKGTAHLSRAARISFAMLCLFANELRATLARTVVYATALALFALVGVEVLTKVHGPDMARDTTEPEWVEVAKPMPVFAMTMPEFSETPRYAIWRHASGQGRKDILSFGEPGGATAMVEIFRAGAEAELDETTASIPELRLSTPAFEKTIETKFGRVAVEPFADRAPGGERRCLRFSRGFGEPKLEINGWFCNAGLEVVDRGMIACALDKLTLIAAGSDPKLGALFAHAELKRNFCGANGVIFAATPKRPDWIEATRDPKLRGRAN